MREVNKGINHSLRIPFSKGALSCDMRRCVSVVRMKYAVRMCGDVAILLFASRPSLRCLGGPGNEEGLEDRWEKRRRRGTYTGEAGSGRARTAHAHTRMQQRHEREGDERDELSDARPVLFPQQPQPRNGGRRKENASGASAYPTLPA